MNYPILEEHYGIDGLSQQGKYKSITDDLHELLLEEESNPMEVDFDPVVSSLYTITNESSYNEKHTVLANLGYLLFHNAASLKGYDEKFNTDKDFADTLVLLWQTGESDERIVDQHLQKAQKLLK